MNMALSQKSESLISEAIDQNIGAIDSLPEAVQAKVKRTYRQFFDAYLNISALKKPIDDPLSHEDTPLRITDFDPEIVGYMQHFFSDYQDLYHEFMSLNRHCRALMRLDPIAHPKAYEQQLQSLFAGNDRAGDDAIMSALIAKKENDDLL